MQSYVAIDPDAVAALVEEHLPPVMRTIVAAYWAGPEIWINVPGKELGAFQITIEWHPGAGHCAGEAPISIQDSEIGSILALPDNGYEIITDICPVRDVTRVMFLPIRASVIPPISESYTPITRSVGPNVELLLNRVHELLVYRAAAIKLFDICPTYAAAQFVSVITGHRFREYYDLDGPNMIPTIKEYIKLRTTENGCTIAEDCTCIECEHELHHACRRDNSQNCTFLNQCRCSCEYCEDGDECGDTQGLCAQQGLMCFRNWKPSA